MIYRVEGKEIIEVPEGLFSTAEDVARRVIVAANLGEGSVLSRMMEHEVGKPPSEVWSLLVLRKEIFGEDGVAVDLYLTGRSPDAEIVEEPVGSGRFHVALHERYNGSTAERVRVALTSST